MPPPPDRSHPAYALVAYAVPLAEGRRVLVVGDSSLDFGDLLLDSGAGSVHIYDPVSERVRARRNAVRGATVLELPRDGFDLRDGTFDLAIVPDLGAVRDPPTLLTRLRRAVGGDGALLVAAKNPSITGQGGIEYGDLFDMVSFEFEYVQMIGQVPFSGVALAELGESNEEPEVSVDMQLGPEDKTPHVFVALASQRDVHLAPYALIELAPAASASADDAALRAMLAETTLKSDLLAAQLDQARAVSQKRLAELEAEVARKTRRIAELEQQLADGKRTHAVVEAKLVASRAGITELEERVAALETELTAAREEVRAASSIPRVEPEVVERLAERAERGDRAVVVLQRLEADLAGIGEHHAAELHQLEALLRERARTIQELEMELVRRERLVKELVGALQEHQEAPHVPAAVAVPAASPAGAEPLEREAAMRERLDALAMEVARREADAQAQTWRIAELEEKLAMKEPAAAPSPDLERQLVQAKSELDALRQALTQEHEARVNVESGEALAKAQAELARQATLIEQLSRELDTRDRVRHAEHHDSPT